MIAYLQNYIYRTENYLQSGGPVMIPLLLVSAVLWVLIFNRAFFLRQLYRKNMTREQANHFVRAGEFPDSRRYKGFTAMFITEFMIRRSGNARMDKRILDETVLALVASLDKYLALIRVLVGVAPLLGLLGTVTGMIATFDIISVFGTGNAKAMAGGISEALITTQTGLLVAIPGLYMSNFLSGRAENLKQQIASLGIYLKRYV